MAQPYVGEIRMFAGNFAPAGWQLCEGQLLPISEFETLFNLIGTTYGGDGQSTFAMPDLRGRAPVHSGTGAGLPTYVLSQSFGAEEVTLTSATFPSHGHTLQAVQARADDDDPRGRLPAVARRAFYGPATGLVAMPAGTVSSGGGQPHENMQPYLAINFIISLFGIFPSPT